VLVQRLPFGEVGEVVAVASVADEEQPGPVPLGFHPDGEAVPVAHLAPDRRQLGRGLRHPVLVPLPAEDQRRV
jgi:hypothetical protein